ncbi:acetyltransferase [uncultured Thiohalocapsa sp.]|uniref:acetyltransferase n=1 Tax=uncultured Thiohalocapsa sp. TaxID=768990 RepID=UPI0025F828A9|nr:acetyltransferase [uncultured Thiohalocapsa sp.]
MPVYDVFNGDADGICALQQLHLAEPRDSVLVTGVKRDIALVQRVEATAGDVVTVLDVSFDKNRDACLALLERGATLRWFDHHFAGEIPEHPGLEVHIETLPDKGTSLLVDEYLGGAHRAWAVVGTYGDNFDEAAARASAPLELPDADLALLRELGILINYNGYGATVEDLHYPPAELFRALAPYADPLAFAREDPAFRRLRDGYREDMARAEAAALLQPGPRHTQVMLPAEPWARRVGGVYANALAQAAPERAHAMLTRRADGGFVVSVRAPLTTRDGADALCRQFDTGGGRKAAAGINHLPEAALDDFIAAFVAAF